MRKPRIEFIDEQIEREIELENAEPDVGAQKVLLAEAAEVARRLYVAHKILVKDCSSKTMFNGDCYLRIAARTPPENERMVKALASVL